MTARLGDVGRSRRRPERVGVLGGAHERMARRWFRVQNALRVREDGSGRCRHELHYKGGERS